MFCPNCGAGDQRVNAYCKRCGEWLTKNRTRASRTFGGETPQQTIFIGLFMSLLSSVVALFSGIALYATHLGKDDVPWSVYVAAAFCVCIAGWQLSSFFIGLRLRRRLERAQAGNEVEPTLKGTQTAHALSAADTSRLVKPSVTEHTTDLLQPIEQSPHYKSRPQRD